MMQAGFLKRSKRTMQNIERHFLDKLVQKALWRYMQFDPERYPNDMKFVVNSTMGMMAKEVENQQLIQMLGFVPAESPGHGIVLQALFENAVSDYKSELQDAIKAINAPPSEEEQQQQQQQQAMQFEAQKQELRKVTLENDKLEAEIEEIKADTEHTDIKADLEDDKVQIAAANAATGAEKARVTARQTDVAAERNQIEIRKINQGATNGTNRSPS
jgi:hypothetical protein